MQERGGSYLLEFGSTVTNVSREQKQNEENAQ
jgi:hypothetical protein